MGTRSYIIVQYDGKNLASYCHYDGYLEGVGKTLIEHYNSQELALNLVLLGGRRTLSEDPLDDLLSDSNFEEIFEDTPTEHFRFLDYLYTFSNGKWYYCDAYVNSLKEISFSEIEWKTVEYGLSAIG